MENENNILKRSFIIDLATTLPPGGTLSETEKRQLATKWNYLNILKPRNNEKEELLCSADFATYIPFVTPGFKYTLLQELPSKIEKNDHYLSDVSLNNEYYVYLTNLYLVRGKKYASNRECFLTFVHNAMKFHIILEPSRALGAKYMNIEKDYVMRLKPQPHFRILVCFREEMESDFFVWLSRNLRSLLQCRLRCFDKNNGTVISTGLIPHEIYSSKYFKISDRCVFREHYPIKNYDSYIIPIIDRTIRLALVQNWNIDKYATLKKLLLNTMNEQNFNRFYIIRAFETQRNFEHPYFVPNELKFFEDSQTEN